jgi:hypothetical protein
LRERIGRSFGPFSCGEIMKCVSCICIYGVRLTETDVYKLANNNNIKYNDACDVIQKLIGKRKGFIHLLDLYCGEGVFVGRLFTSINSCETGDEFKQSVISFLKEIGVSKKPKYIMEAVV